MHPPIFSVHATQIPKASPCVIPLCTQLTYNGMITMDGYTGPISIYMKQHAHVNQYMHAFDRIRVQANLFMPSILHTWNADTQSFQATHDTTMHPIIEWDINDTIIIPSIDDIPYPRTAGDVGAYIKTVIESLVGLATPHTPEGIAHIGHIIGAYIKTHPHTAGLDIDSIFLHYINPHTLRIEIHDIDSEHTRWFTGIFHDPIPTIMATPSPIPTSIYPAITSTRQALYTSITQHLDDHHTTTPAVPDINTLFSLAYIC